jgi:hypothetical protein
MPHGGLHKNSKIANWRGFSGIFALKFPWMLGFTKPTFPAKRASVQTASTQDTRCDCELRSGAAAQD